MFFLSLILLSKYVKEHPESDSFKASAAKVFMSLDSSLKTLEDCRFKLDTICEEQFKPERDFVELLEIKKERHFEQYFEKCSAEINDKRQNDRANLKENADGSSLVDDQDLRPMDLEAEQQMLQQNRRRGREESKLPNEE